MNALPQTTTPAPALGFRVVHVAADQRPRRAVFQQAGRTAAEALATAMWGQPLYLAALRLPALQPQQPQQVQP